MDRSARTLAACCVMLTILIAGAFNLAPSRAQKGAPGKAANPQQWTEEEAKLIERDRHGEEATRLRNEGKFDEAVVPVT